MGLQGVNRVLMAVHDLEKAKALYSDMLGATFEDAHWTGEPFGIAVAIAWDAGIELCAPLPGRENDSAVSAFLASKGEGVMNVFFAVSDGEAAMERVAALGIGCFNALDYTQAEIDAHLGGHFRRYQEFTLNTGAQCGFTVSLARIEQKTDQEEPA